MRKDTIKSRGDLETSRSPINRMTQDKSFIEFLDSLISEQRLTNEFKRTVDACYAPLAKRIVTRHSVRCHPLLVGLCGPQGCGKSTGAAVLQALLEYQGLNTAVLSIDDLYLTRAERAHLAASVHPMLATRGPPGTHDLALGQSILDALLAGSSTALPRFDKAMDDRLPKEAWPSFNGPVDVVLFEGWCVGAKPQSSSDLTEPVNDLERDEDPNGVWRTFVNNALGEYQTLFSRIGMLIQLRPPDFSVVRSWRREQEHKLRARNVNRASTQVMSDDQIDHFIGHYERITRSIINEMPLYADIVIELDTERNMLSMAGTADLASHQQLQ